MLVLLAYLNGVDSYTKWQQIYSVEEFILEKSYVLFLPCSDINLRECTDTPYVG